MNDTIKLQSALAETERRWREEQRKAAAIERNEKIKKELRRIRVEKRRDETPEQRMARQKTEQELCEMLAMVECYRF